MEDVFIRELIDFSNGLVFSITVNQKLKISYIFY